MQQHVRLKRRRLQIFSFRFELSLLLWNDTYMIMVGCPWCVGVVFGLVCVGLCGGCWWCWCVVCGVCGVCVVSCVVRVLRV